MASTVTLRFFKYRSSILYGCLAPEASSSVITTAGPVDVSTFAVGPSVEGPMASGVSWAAAEGASACGCELEACGAGGEVSCDGICAAGAAGDGSVVCAAAGWAAGEVVVSAADDGAAAPDCCCCCCGDDGPSATGSRVVAFDCRSLISTGGIAAEESPAALGGVLSAVVDIAGGGLVCVGVWEA
jgi:hypothetical protein